MMDNETQALIDVYKRQDGAMDWYKVFDLPPTATQDQIEAAFHLLSATFDPRSGEVDREGTVRYVLLQQGFKEIGDPIRRRKYDAFLRFQYEHARRLVTIDATRQAHRTDQMLTGFHRPLRRVNTRLKRLALLAFPFFAVTDLFLLASDMDRYRWEPSISFTLFLMLSVLCLLVSFTRLGDWVHSG